MTYWGKHRHVMGPSKGWGVHQDRRRPYTPIETDRGWLIFYHGVLTSCNGFVYSFSAALLDRMSPGEEFFSGQLPHQPQGAL